MGNNDSKPTPENNMDLPVFRRGGAKFETVERILRDRRGHLVTALENQTYSLLQEFPGFTALRGDEAKLDLCVLGNKPQIENLTARQKPMQDEAVALEADGLHLFGIFDGHGKEGHKVAQTSVLQATNLFLGENTPLTDYVPEKGERNSRVPEQDNFVYDFEEKPKESLNNLIPKLHKTVTNANDYSCHEAGATATFCLLEEHALHLSWVGDSKAVLLVSTTDDFSDMTAFNVTSKHNFQTDAEKARIKAAGGMVGRQGCNIVNGKGGSGPLRVYSRKGDHKPALVISRSIGDVYAHSLGVTDTPEYFKLDFKSFDTIRELKEIIPFEFQDQDEMPEEDIPKKGGGGGGKGLMATLSRLTRRRKKKGLNKSQVSSSAKINSGFSMADSSSFEHTMHSVNKRKFSVDGGSKKMEFPLGKQSSLQEVEDRITPMMHSPQKDAKEASGMSLKSTKSSFMKRKASLLPTFFNRGKSSTKATKSQANRATGVSAVNQDIDEDAKIKHCVLVVASDGLWDGMTNKEAAYYLRRWLQEGSTANLSLKLALQAQEHWIHRVHNTYIDDISVVTAVLF